jgi:thymidylate synthase ThyX
MLEHGTVYLTVFITASDKETFNYRDDIIRKLRENPYTKFNHRVDNGNYYYFTTNYRVIVENGWENIMQEFQSVCTEYHPNRKTFKFICNRGVSHEYVRHRVFSFGQESQRYCNYSKDKYGNQITFVEPIWLDKCKDLTGWSVWSSHMECCQDSYFQLLNQGKKPQEARGVLPNDTKTELCMTGFESDWDAFFKLRCAPDAHPEAQYLANMCRDIFNKGTL